MEIKNLVKHQNKMYIRLEFFTKIWLCFHVLDNIELLSLLMDSVFECLPDIICFCDVSIDPDSEAIIWSNGMNVAPEYLYFQAF